MLKKNLPILISLMFLLLLMGCNKDTVQSVWNNRQLQVDGLYADWGGDLRYNEKSNIGFGVANDSTDLYLCLMSNDQQIIRQVMARGLELEVDIPKVKRHTFKIKYPVGIAGMNMSAARSGRKTGGSRDLLPAIENMQTEFRLFGPGREDERIIPLRNNLGIDISVGRSQRKLVYEIKLPLRVIKEYFGIDQSVAITAMKIQFKMPDLSSGGNISGSMGGRKGGGGLSGGGGGGRGSGMGTAPGGMRRPAAVSDSFKFKIPVLLANPPG